MVNEGFFGGEEDSWSLEGLQLLAKVNQKAGALPQLCGVVGAKITESNIETFKSFITDLVKGDEVARVKALMGGFASGGFLPHLETHFPNSKMRATSDLFSSAVRGDNLGSFLYLLSATENIVIPPRTAPGQLFTLPNGFGFSFKFGEVSKGTRILQFFVENQGEIKLPDGANLLKTFLFNVETFCGLGSLGNLEALSYLTAVPVEVSEVKFEQMLLLLRASVLGAIHSGKTEVVQWIFEELGDYSARIGEVVSVSSCLQQFSQAGVPTLPRIDIFKLLYRKMNIREYVVDTVSKEEGGGQYQHVGYLLADEFLYCREPAILDFLLEEGFTFSRDCFHKIVFNSNFMCNFHVEMLPVVAFLLERGIEVNIDTVRNRYLPNYMRIAWMKLLPKIDPKEIAVFTKVFGQSCVPYLESVSPSIFMGPFINRAHLRTKNRIRFTEIENLYEYFLKENRRLKEMFIEKAHDIPEADLSRLKESLKLPLH